MKSSYEYLKEDMELLSYVTRDDMLYVILEDDLYQIDIKQKSFSDCKRKTDQRPICGLKVSGEPCLDGSGRGKCMHTDHGDEPGAGEILIRSRHSPDRRSRHWDL